MHNSQNLKYYLQFLIIIVITYGCSYKWKSTFFDGVPKPENNFTVSLDSTSLSNDSVLKLVKPKTLIHQPYKEKKCFECHDNNRLGKLKMEIPNLCYKCHENNDAKFAFGHGPVSSGNCTQCHSPHLSKNENLLLKPGNDLCFNCHNETDVKNTTGIHTNLENEKCTQCHNAHGSNTKNILKSNTCFNCHDDFKKDMNFIHGPVEAGKCSMCHTETHNSKKEALLVKRDNQLCLDCHNLKDLKNRNKLVHKDETEQCLQCHDSHASLNEYLLIRTNN